MTSRRMGFLIVFDVNNEDSLKAAQHIFDDLMEKRPTHHKIFLVANKIDKDPLSVGFRRNCEAARLFAQDKGIRYREVSALEYTHVKKLFREMVEEICMQPELWGGSAGIGLKGDAAGQSSFGVNAAA